MHTEQIVVFYVDDNSKSRRFLSSILVNFGFEVITANGPLDALELCEQITFDIALLDYETPKMRSSELAQDMKFLLPDVPIVLISGTSVLPLADLAFVDAHFGSGTDLDELISRLHMLVQSKPGLAKSGRSVSQWADST